ncbi:MAG: sulfite exporter TauE/SafE family protein [Alphaproteobacteria bacterium]|nr:sulfite exporter TauE/SafE family protein [Alphaproteobacteria bacterium]
MTGLMSADILAAASGGLVGLVLGLIGGGGSIIALPLLVYVVGMPSVHLAIGTSALAVALNAGASLAAHNRAGTVRWPCALVFAVAGILGAWFGAQAGKAVDGQKLLALFGLLMIGVGLNMLRSGTAGEEDFERLSRSNISTMGPWLAGTGFAVGLLSGFFGIGGGFLVVPGLMLASGMPLPNAIGTSLVAVTAFGLTTAGSYATAGLVDWRIAGFAIGGGVAGAVLGTRASVRLAGSRKALARIFAAVVILTGLYILWRGVPALLAGWGG